MVAIHSILEYHSSWDAEKAASPFDRIVRNCFYDLSPTSFHPNCDKSFMLVFDSLFDSFLSKNIS